MFETLHQPTTPIINTVADDIMYTIFLHTAVKNVEPETKHGP